MPLKSPQDSRPGGPRGPVGVPDVRGPEAPQRIGSACDWTFVREVWRVLGWCLRPALKKSCGPAVARAWDPADCSSAGGVAAHWAEHIW
ncbi:hypothetical protein NDU88_010984 [Pleurodeles waltl]|uniref:Uncharacterized protein n=1 Tax=Pleurodeles waltl TaxID=8319 RepID=A0AAV7S2X9_PLEWA|nr:hypothetical protein NDU88_010984 [Pleurodeles waltl]